MDGGSVALALAAGMLAAVNPCGFAMLPAYASLLISSEREASTATVRLRRALALTLAMTAGFAAIFAAFGFVTAAAGEWLLAYLPWVTVVIGVVLTGLGIWLLAGRDLPSPVPKQVRAPQLRQTAASMALFGISFAIASLGCTIGPFLLTVVTAFRGGSIASGIGLFLAYAAGMALVVGTVAMAVALAQQGAIRALRKAGTIVPRIAGLLMLLTGVYVAWYGRYEIRLATDPRNTDPFIEAAGRLQTQFATWIDKTGPVPWLVAVIAVSLSVLAVTRLRRR